MAPGYYYRDCVRLALYQKLGALNRHTMNGGPTTSQDLRTGYLSEKMQRAEAHSAFRLLNHKLYFHSRTCIGSSEAKVHT